jgi:hypothetical protein
MSPELPESLRVLFLTLDALEELGIPYHLGGSFASSIHGAPRQTQDIDLVVELGSDDAASLVSRLEGAFYGSAPRARRAVETGQSFNLVHLESGVKVDLFPRGRSTFDSEEFERRIPVTLGEPPGRTAFVKSAEDTILRKLLWFRHGGGVSDRQWSDVLGVLRTQGDRLDDEYLARWAAELGIEGLLREAKGSV